MLPKSTRTRHANAQSGDNDSPAASFSLFRLSPVFRPLGSLFLGGPGRSRRAFPTGRDAERDQGQGIDLAQRQVLLPRRDGVQVHDAQHCELIPQVPIRPGMRKRDVHFFGVDDHRGTASTEPAHVVAHKERVHDLRATVRGHQVGLDALMQRPSTMGTRARLIDGVCAG